MLAVFCLRLAAGMLACLLLLPARLVHPRFYRTHFLVALGLAALAAVSAWDGAGGAARGLLLAGVALAFGGSALWSVEGAPGGRALIVATVLVLGGALGLLDVASGGRPPAGLGPHQPADAGRSPAEVAAADVTSAALLGSTFTAMLLGHSYLIAPGMSLTPLLRLIAAVGVAALARMAVDGYALARWTAEHSFSTLGNDLLLWLPLRWALGFAGPLALGWMAWQAARIRSTQSATGILYVVVVFCSLGELTSLLLRAAGVTL
jgi:hypothetical protein